MLSNKISALLFLFIFSVSSSLAQSVTNVGAENTLEVATWNIEWFGSPSNGPSNDNLQIDNAAAIIAGSGIDIWGVQEIADGEDFDDLLTLLGDDFDGTLATNSVQQKIGYVYNKNVIRVRQVKHILESFSHAFASRPPLQLEADIILPDTTVIVTFIVLHMKAFSDFESYERRVDASNRLKNHIDFTALNGEHVIVLGDFNDELEQSTSGGRISPYDNFLQDADNFAFLTLPIEQNGDGSFCTTSTCSSTGSMLDHLLISDELFSDYVSGSAGFIPNLTDDIAVFGNTTSDHLPVISRFDFGQTILDREVLPSQPAPFILEAPYPNPFSNTTSLTVSLTKPSHLTIKVFDLLGRHILTLENQIAQPGSHQHMFSLSSSASRGVYIVRITADEFVETVPVTYLK